ncbi:MAG: ion transporter [Chloroflexota bacterium]
MNLTLDHLKAREMSSHEARVTQIQNSVAHWRLTDCSVDALEKMRHRLLEEMELLEKALDKANQQFLRFVENGRPLETTAIRENINQLSNKWQSLNTHLKDVDDAVLERHLQTRLEETLGSRLLTSILDSVVLVTIFVAIILTIAEFVFVLPENTIDVISQIDLVISLFLLGDFFLRLYLSEDRRWYFRRYWIDFVASLPLANVLKLGRLARIARFARLLRLFRLGRALRVLRYTFRGFDKLFATFELNLLRRALWIASGLLFFGAFSITIFEGHQEASLQELQHSLWWSFTTVVTGGFADLYNPSTVPGQLVTVGLVLLGLTITGIFTASLTSVLVDDGSSELELKQLEIQDSLGNLNQKLDLLSGETNEGLIALETIAQALSNQQSIEEIAAVLGKAMIENFAAMQASVHLLGENGRFTQVSNCGRVDLAPPPNSSVSDGFMGTTLRDLLQETELATVDIEPQIEPAFSIDGSVMICPLVANLQVFGALYCVLPAQKGRYYLYNRAPMTLAHHAAIAIFAEKCKETATSLD